MSVQIKKYLESVYSNTIWSNCRWQYLLQESVSHQKLATRLVQLVFFVSYLINSICLTPEAPTLQIGETLSARSFFMLTLCCVALALRNGSSTEWGL